MLWYPLAFLLALGILVTVHELGHFLAARACGIKVLRFSIGFGRTLYSRSFVKDGTEWVVGLIPLGGYVKMLDEREGDVPAAELSQAFNRQSLIKRTMVVVAGPLANLALAVLIYWFMFMVGVQEMRPLLAAPASGTPAAEAGIDAGWLVQSVDGRTVQTWSELRLLLLEARLKNQSAELELLEGDAHHSLRLKTDSLTSSDLDGDMMRKLGLLPFQPRLAPVIGSIQAGSPAQQAGLLPGDRIILLDGAQVEHWGDVVDGIRAAPGRALMLDVARQGRQEQVVVTPERIESKGKFFGRLGAAVKLDGPNPLLLEIRYGPIDALVQALKQTRDTIQLSLSMIGSMLTGDISWKNISGPVTIADYAGQTAQMGMMSYVRFIALISISLGVLNLLPIPVLDGGHLMYYLVEFFKGSPVSERVMELGQRIGFVILGLLTAFALFNDINRLFFG